MRKIIIPGIFFLLLSTLYSRILFINPTTQLIGDGGDNYEYLGYIHLVHQNISNLKYPFAHTTTLRYPVGFDLSYGYDGAFFVLTGTLLSFIIPLPLAYNITTVLVFWLNLFVPFLCLRYILSFLYANQQNNNLISFLGALMYGWSPYVFARMNGHMNLALVVGLPLITASVFQIANKFKKNTLLTFIDFLYIALGLLFISMGSLQYLFIFMQFVLLSIILWFIKSLYNNKANILPAKTIPVRYVWYFVASSLLFIIPFLFMYGGYLYAIITNNIYSSSLTYTHPNFRPTLLDLFIPNMSIGDLWRSINSSKSTLERVVTFGVFEWILIIIFFIGTKEKKAKYVVLLLLMFFFVMILLLRPILVPEPSRIWIFLAWPILTLVTIHIRNFSRNILILLLFLLLVERGSYTIKTSPPLPQEIARLVAKQPGTAVLHVPLSEKSYRSMLAYLWNKSILDGGFLHTARNLKTYTTLHDPDINKFICSNETYNKINNEDIKRIMMKLKSLDITTIVLVKQGGDGELWWFQECANVRKLWEQINPERAIADETKIIEHKFEFGRGSPINARLMLDKSGLFRLERMTIYPHSINDFALATPGGTLIAPNWNTVQQGKGDLIVDFFPRLFFPVQAGEYFTLISHTQSLDSNIYAIIYYQYKPDINNYHIYNENKVAIQKPYVKLLWKDDRMEVYTIL